MENELVVVGQSNTELTVKQKTSTKLTEAQKANINSNAEKAVTELVLSGADIFSEAADQIINIGIKDQKAISDNLALMQERMGDVFYSKEKSNVTTDLSKDIYDLKESLEGINPSSIEKRSLYRFLSWIPFVGNKSVYYLKQSVNKGMTLKGFVEHLAESLATGERMLRQDNAELKVINDQLLQKQEVIKTDAYFAEVILEKLNDAVRSTKDQQLKNNLNEIIFKVSTRVQDLRAMENIHQQFFASLKMTRNNNDLLIDGARRMQTMGMTVVYTSMELHAALIRSKKVKDVEVQTGQFIGKQLVSNAQIIHGMVLEIGDLYKNPFVPMKMIEDAVGELQKAIEDTNKLKAEGIEAAKQNTAKIKIWTEELQNKSGDLPSMDVKSLEYKNVLMIEGSNTITNAEVK